MASRNNTNRHHHHPNNINIGGDFNFKLKKTGFLTEIKKSSRLIAKNPLKFLDDYADNKIGPQEGAALASSSAGAAAADSECSKLKSFINNLQVQPCLATKQVEIAKKQEYVRRRSCLLNMASTNIVNVNLADMNSMRRGTTGGRGGGGSSSRMMANEDDDSDADNESASSTSRASRALEHDTHVLDQMIGSYIEQLKTKILGMGHIFDWISSTTKMTGMKLPYGLPSALKIPSDPDAPFLTTNENESQKDVFKMAMSKYASDFIESSIDNFLLLDGEYHAKIEQITKQLDENQTKLVQSIPDEEHAAAADGTDKEKWKIADTAILAYITNCLEQEEPSSTLTTRASTGIRVNLVVQSELISRLFPAKSKESIINQKYYLKFKKLLLEKRANIILDWIHVKTELTTKINTGWAELNKKVSKSREQKMAARKQRELCSYWSTLLDEYRAEKCEKVKKLQLLLEPLRRKREEELATQKRLEAARRKEIRETLAQFKDKKQQLQMEQLLEKEHEQDLLEEMRRVREKLNTIRVDYRRNEWLSKEQRRKEEMRAKEVEILARAAKLESIKEPVDLKYDPWNIINDTHASAVRRYETLQETAAKASNSDEQKMINFFRESYSFPAEKLLQDRRLRLEMKLRDSGLIESSYARQVLQAMQPKEKPHLKTQIKFSHDDD